MPEAGWYPDPSGTADWRRWDGVEWTHETRADRTTANRPFPATKSWLASHRGWIGGIAITLTLVVALLSRDTSGAPSKLGLTAAQVATRLAPLGCRAVTNGRSPPLLAGEIRPQAALTCTIDGEDTSISQWQTHADLERQIAIAKAFACPLARGFGTSDIVVVTGDNWAVSPASQTVGDKIRAAIGGSELRVIPC